MISMNKIFSVLIMCVLFISCKKQFEGFTKFTISYSEEATISSSTGVNLPFNINTPPTETNSKQEFKNEKTRKDLIKEIFIENISIEIKNPSSADFSFLEEVTIYIKADGLDEKSVAWKKPVVNTGSNILKLDVTSHDLQEYIKMDSFTLRINAITDELLTQDHTLNISTKFNISAKLLN
jgi:hypothetical protein